MAPAVKSTAPQFTCAAATITSVSVARPAGKLATIAMMLGTSALSRPLFASEVDFFTVYAAPSECPTRAQFEGAVASRTAGSQAVERSTATLAFEVELTKRSDTFAGALVIELPDGSRSRRDAFGATCAEVVESLAVIAALSLEGYRSNAAGSGNPSAAGAAPGAAASAETAAAARPQPEQQPAAPPPPAAAANPVAPRAPAAEPSRSALRWRPGLFAGAAWESAVAPNAPLGAPNAPLGATAGFELAREPSGAFWPSLRLGVLFTGPATIERGSASAEFQLVTGRLSPCPLGFGKPRGASLHACLELDAGALRTDARGVANANPEWLPWLAAGLAARGELALAPWFALEATVGARLLARHYRLVFNSSDSPDPVLVYDMPLVSAGVAVGVVARLP
jgi:hypothetical protein